MRGSSYAQQNPAQSPSPLYRPSPSPNFENSPSYNAMYRPQNSNRPPTPVYLREQSREDLYNKQLRQSIGNKLNLHNRNLPVFPMMDDQHSLASDTMLRPSSFRPGSASNPDFMLPKDVQFYYKQKEKIFTKLDGFYKEEKKGIEEMMDECLKSIITLFEDHKQGLFKNLDDDQETFGRVYNRFSEGVDSFLKTAETRLENNLKAYETRILKIQEDDQNPLGTHIEKLRLEKEMLNSKERIIQEIKQSYEKSTIPGDKQKIGELMVEEYKKKHSANLSNLAQHMQTMIGSLKKSIDGFNTFKNYASLDEVKNENYNLTPNVPKNDPIQPQTIPEEEQSKAMMATLNNLMRQSGNQNNFGVGPNQVPLPSTGLTQQQLMLQNLAQMGISPNFLGTPTPTPEAYQMALLKAQMGISDPQDQRTLAQTNYLNKNYDGTILNPHINGNLNINLLHAQGNDPNRVNQTPNINKTSTPGLSEKEDKPKIRPAIKSPNQKLAELKKEEAQPQKMLVNKKSVTFNLTSSQNEAKNELPSMQFQDKGDDINEVIKKYKQIDKSPQTYQKPENTQNERAKSPILEAKESINQFNDIYENSKNKLFNYQYGKEYSPKEDYKQALNNQNSRAENIMRRQTAPFGEPRHELSTPDRPRKNTFQPLSKQPASDIRSGISPNEPNLKIAPFPHSMSKHKFDKNILKPKDKRQLEMDINRLGEKYGASKSKNNRPLSQNIKTIRSNVRPSKGKCNIKGVPQSIIRR